MNRNRRVRAAADKLARATWPACLSMAGALALPACAPGPDGFEATQPVAEEAVDTSGEQAAASAGVGEVRSRTFETPQGPLELTYAHVDGRNVYQGDIILPDPDAPDYRSAGTTSLSSRWPHGIVYYSSTGLAGDARVTGAIAHWQQRTRLRFVQSNSASSRINFVASDSCSSSLGRIGGVQNINLSSGCSLGSTIHEIGHALGLFHEQSRTDRNDNIQVFTNCIQTGKEHAFAMFGSNGMNIGPYDLGSIMHYSSTAFLDTSKSGCTATMLTAAGGVINAQRSGLSTGDINGANLLYNAWTTVRTAADYDGDKRADIAVFRPSTGRWTIRQSTTHTNREVTWGIAHDVPVPADYDGDGKADVAVWRPSDGNFYVINSSNGVKSQRQWGEATDIPVPADYDGDGKADLAIWRPSIGTFMVTQSSNGVRFERQFGVIGDIPVPGHFDSDRKADFVVFRPSDGKWYLWKTQTAQGQDVRWGTAGDIPVSADFNGDTRTDLAVYRPSDGTWYSMVLETLQPFLQQRWGIADDVPVPGDYDGDGKSDLAQFRPSNGTWYRVNSVLSGGFPENVLGARGDIPVP